MQQIKLTPTEAILYLTILNTILGILFGLIPLILGIRRKKKSLGIYGLICSAIGGAILGLFLIIPVLIVFLWLILKKPNAGEINPTDTNETPSRDVSASENSDSNVF
ncbi:MAG: hypothetical protein M3033_11210 [Acidobacteriota bacterium]|nr:hypothetical protein [Acidobacteriota bacterium]